MNYDDGYVYFIRAKELGLVKIGYTMNHPRKRLSQLDTASPVALTLEGYRRASFDIEQAIHRKFAAFHVRREWFRYEGELKRFIGAEKVHDYEKRITSVPYTPTVRRPYEEVEAERREAMRAEYKILAEQHEASLALVNSHPSPEPAR